MKKVIQVFMFVFIAKVDIAQSNATSPFCGRWVNTQYDYCKRIDPTGKLTYKVSPWYINVDSVGKCRIEFQFEHETTFGYPVEKDSKFGHITYHYRKRYDFWLYTIEGHDSLLIYNKCNTPGTGIVFRKCID